MILHFMAFDPDIIIFQRCKKVYPQLVTHGLNVQGEKVKKGG